MNSKTTSKQDKQYRIFAQEYIINFNGTEAAIKAGYSEKTATVQASRLLTYAKVQEYIKFYMQEREKRTEITSDSVVQDIQTAREIALGIKPHKVIIKDSIGDGMTQHIEQELHKTDLTSFVKLTELQMRHLGMFNDKLKLDGEFSLSSFVKERHESGN